MNWVALGYLGSFLILFSYALFVTGKLKSLDLIYIFMSVAGCILVGINSFLLSAYPSLIVNVTFAIIPIVNYIAKKKKK